MNSEENSKQSFNRSDSQDSQDEDDTENSDDNSSDRSDSEEEKSIKQTEQKPSHPPRKFSKDTASDQPIARMAPRLDREEPRKRELPPHQLSKNPSKDQLNKSREYGNKRIIDDPTFLRKRSPEHSGIPIPAIRDLDYRTESKKDQSSSINNSWKEPHRSSNLMQTELPFKVSRTIIPSTEISPYPSSNFETKKTLSVNMPPSPLTLPDRSFSAPENIDIPTINQRQETINLDHQTAVYLTKTESPIEQPFDYQDFEFNELHQYLSELTRNIAESVSRPLHFCKGLRHDTEHALGMLADLVEVLFYQSFDGRDYLFKGHLGKHIQNLVGYLKESAHHHNEHLKAALTKINAGLKELANVSFRTNRAETNQVVPSVLNIPPSYFLLLASKSGWLKSQFRLRMLKNIRERLTSVLQVKSACFSLVLAIDIEKEAHRVYPSFDSCSKYVGLVRELLAEIKVVLYFISES